MATILVVDDSDSVRALICQRLLLRGHEVLQAGDGQSALLQIEGQVPDLVLTDIYMPNGDGIELLNQLRARRFTGCTIAMSSATGNFDQLRVARLLGAKITLTKPFTDLELDAALTKALPASAAGPKPPPAE